MQTNISKKHTSWLKLIVFILVIVLLCQDAAWAGRGRANNFKLSAESGLRQERLRRHFQARYLKRLEARMFQEDYPEELIAEYQSAAKKWELALKKSGRRDKRKNFKIAVNVYNDAASLNTLLESIYEELNVFAYGKGVEVCVVEHSDDPEERKLNEKAVAYWNKRIGELGREDWRFRYVSLAEQLKVVREVEQASGINVAEKYVYCSGEVRQPEDLAGTGFCGSMNAALLWLQTEVDPEDKNTLVMFFDQDVEIGALLRGDNGKRKRKIVHTFHYLSRAFDNPEVNILASALNGDLANSFRGLKEFFMSFRAFLQMAIEGERLVDARRLWQKGYQMEGDLPVLSWQDIFRRMFGELENVKRGKISIVRKLHKGEATILGRGKRSPFGTGFVIRSGLLALAPVVNVPLGGDLYYEYFLRYFRDSIWQIKLPVIHNRNALKAPLLTAYLPTYLTASVDIVAMKLWFERKIDGARERGLLEFSVDEQGDAASRIEDGDSVMDIVVDVITRLLLAEREAKKVRNLLDHPAFAEYGEDLVWAREFIDEFIEQAEVLVNQQFVVSARRAVDELREQIPVWRESLEQWHAVSGAIQRKKRLDPETAGKNAEKKRQPEDPNRSCGTI